MITNSYESLRGDLEKNLNACVDVKDAADALGRTLDKLRMETRSQADTPALSRETDRLFDAARQAALMMLSVTEADITARPALLTGKDKLRQALPWASAGISLVLTAWMELLGQHAGAVVALIGAGVSVAQAWLKQSRPDAADMTARTRVDARELMRLSDRLIHALDDALEQARSEQLTAATNDKPALTSDWYAPIQMLMEAVYTQDGAYALKAVPQLTSALEDQGIELCPFTEENRAWFDMFPGTEPGLTIRPALVKNGRVLARGQATESMA